MKPQIYLASCTREMFLERHNFYVEQAQKRVLSSLSDISSEATTSSEEVYKKMGAEPAYSDSFDMSDIAEYATEAGQNHYLLLYDLKKQMYLGVVAGMYHQWDKDLREFMARELRGCKIIPKSKPIPIEDFIWDKDISKIFSLLEQFDWDCCKKSFFTQLDACRMVVNVYKHGYGNSLKSLNTKHPEYLKDDILDQGLPQLALDFLGYDRLSVTETQFLEFAKSIQNFWEQFPERLFQK